MNESAIDSSGGTNCHVNFFYVFSLFFLFLQYILLCVVITVLYVTSTAAHLKSIEKAAHLFKRRRQLAFNDIGNSYVPRLMRKCGSEFVIPDRLARFHEVGVWI